jgi:hypothetical protein
MLPKNEFRPRTAGKKSLFRTLFEELYIDRFPERKQTESDRTESELPKRIRKPIRPQRPG